MGELLIVLAERNGGVRISAFVVFPFPFSSLPFAGYVIRWGKVGGKRDLDGTAHTTTASAGTISSPSDPFVPR